MWLNYFVKWLLKKAREQNAICPCHKAAILPRGSKKALFYHAKPHPLVYIARLIVVKQSSFGLPGQYGRRVTRVNAPNEPRLRCYITLLKRSLLCCKFCGQKWLGFTSAIDNNGTESRMRKNGVYFVDSTLGCRVIQHFDLWKLEDLWRHKSSSLYKSKSWITRQPRILLQ